MKTKCCESKKSRTQPFKTLETSHFYKYNVKRRLADPFYLGEDAVLIYSKKEELPTFLVMK